MDDDCNMWSNYTLVSLNWSILILATLTILLISSFNWKKKFIKVWKRKKKHEESQNSLVEFEIHLFFLPYLSEKVSFTVRLLKQYYNNWTVFLQWRKNKDFFLFCRKNWVFLTINLLVSISLFSISLYIKRCLLGYKK